MQLSEVYSTIEKLQEVNPMLGFRGCRLGITYPEITEMQVRKRLVTIPELATLSTFILLFFDSV